MVIKIDRREVSTFLPEKTSRNLNLKSASRFVDFSKYKNRDFLKLLRPVIQNLINPGKCTQIAHGKLTDLCSDANRRPRKQRLTRLWKNAITIRNFGLQILSELCESFPDKQIVFKPYKDEAHELVSQIDDKCQKFSNYCFDHSGSDYWELYSRAELLISDFSSTAYSFALGMQKACDFFQPK